MKILLANKKELEVIRLNRSIGNSDQFDESLMISFGKNVTIEEVSEALTENSVGDITLVRDGYDDKKYTGYSIQNIVEDTSPESTNVSAFLIK